MTADSDSTDKLQRYREKRDAGSTPEPFGGATTAQTDSNQGAFVVQLHHAGHRHYDFRIELDGVLLSWAVPKGPTLAAGKKRLAVQTEDHPLEYAQFEGVIPQDNYGAGTVIIWDRGTWEPIHDAAVNPREALSRGVLHMRLFGFKLRGQWMLVRTGEGGAKSRQWLLFKKADEYASDEQILTDESVLSGLTVEQVRARHEGEDERGAAMRAELDRLGLTGSTDGSGEDPGIGIDDVKPMLCYVADEPFTNPDWLFELKYDGYRLLAEKRNGVASLRYRSGGDATRLFPEIARAVAALPFSNFILDGEVVVLGDDGAPVFNRLQQRNNLVREMDITRAAVLHPATYMAFDLLACERRDVRQLPVIVRKHLLRRTLPKLGVIKYSDHVLGRGEDLYELVRQRSLEGMVAKRADAPYVGKRSELWLKIRVEYIDDFVIVGYTTPRGTRAGFGSLHLAVREGETWAYAGKVGTGFDQQFLLALSEVLERATPWEPTFQPPSSAQREDFWVEPQLVCVVKYQDWPDGLHLRFPRFLYLRDDKQPSECLRPQRGSAHKRRAEKDSEKDSEKDAEKDPDQGPGADQTAESARQPAGDPERDAASSGVGDLDDSLPLARLERAEAKNPRPVRLTNLDKIYFPARDGAPQYRKGRLIDYYRDIAPYALPYLADRPIAVVRYPNGIDGDSFFQKDMPTWLPDWIRTETLWSRHVQRELRYVICEHAETLAFLANMGAVPIHAWTSRVATLSRPDFCVLDLDPKGAPMSHVVTIARAIRDLCSQLELVCAAKTSGQDGLHVLIPLGARYTFQQCRGLAELLAKVIAAEHSDIATTARKIEHRRGRVYIDYVQNAHGRLLVAPLSVRPRAGAPVSMPLRWREVNDKLDPSRFTIANAVRRMERMTDDPLRIALTGQCDLPRALLLLSERVAALAE